MHICIDIVVCGGDESINHAKYDKLHELWSRYLKGNDY